MKMTNYSVHRSPVCQICGKRHPQPVAAPKPEPVVVETFKPLVERKARFRDGILNTIQGPQLNISEKL